MIVKSRNIQFEGWRAGRAGRAGGLTPLKDLRLLRAGWQAGSLPHLVLTRQLGSILAENFSRRVRLLKWRRIAVHGFERKRQ